MRMLMRMPDAHAAMRMRMPSAPHAKGVVRKPWPWPDPGLSPGPGHNPQPLAITPIGLRKRSSDTEGLHTFVLHAAAAAVFYCSHMRVVLLLNCNTERYLLGMGRLL
jgi:hypothetical protein